MPPAVLWAVPTLLSTHTAEEALTMADYLPVARAHIPALLAPLVGTPTLPTLMAVLAVVTVAPLAVAWCAERPARFPAAPSTVVLVQGLVALNVVWHLGVAVALGGYAPGLLTAMVVNLPFSVYFFRRALVEGWCSRRQLRWLPALVVLVHGPGLWLLFAFTRVVIDAATSLRRMP